MKLFIDHGMDDVDVLTQAMGLAIQKNNSEIVAYLIEQGAALICPDGSCALTHAIEVSSTEIVEMLYRAVIEQGLCVREPVLVTACRVGRLELVNRFIEMGIHVNESYVHTLPSGASTTANALWIAAQYDRVEIVKVLLTFMGINVL